MKPRLRFIVVLFAVLALAAFCGSRINAQDRAKPRDRGQSSSERKREAQPQDRRQRPSGETQPSRPQREERTERNDAERRHPQSRAEDRRDNDDRRGREADRQRDYDRNRPGLSDAERRHPQPDGRYDRGRDNRRDWDRYHWRSWNHRNRYDRDRFPRFYFGLRLFDGRYYRGYGFGPHYRLWYYDRSWQMFYWPYPYAPMYGCGWYWVPTDRRLVYDPYQDDEYWDYSDYRRIYVCFN